MPRFTPEQQLKRMMWLGPIVAPLVVGSLWVLYIVAAAFHFDIFKHAEPPDAFKRLFYLIFAIVGTVLAIPLTWLSVQKSKILLTRGRHVTGRIVSVGGVSRYGMTPVTFEYTVDGVQYTIKRDWYEDEVENFDDSTTADIVYDPRKPGRCMVMSTTADQTAGNSKSTEKADGNGSHLFH